MNCPLCNNLSSRPAGIGPTVYHGKTFTYCECRECHSVFVSPMPDADDLLLMYGDDYARFLSKDVCHSGEGGVQRILQSIVSLPKGAFLDYGCGSGALLRHVSDLGWQCYGVELDRSITSGIVSEGPCLIVNDLSAIQDTTHFDVINFGDVIEHLTNVNSEVPPILARLKPGGRVIAQGPLEANKHLFFYALKLKNSLRRSILSEPPYHVSLATCEGQQKFFSRFELDQEEFDVFEVAHPAPRSLSFGDLKSLRTVTLFVLRKVSQVVTAIAGQRMGNRYFYVGTKPK